MKLTRNILEGAAGTAAMTLFSHRLSDKKGANYSEPDLLAQFVERSVPGMSKQQSKIAGWALHYAVGVGMMSAFRAVARRGGVGRVLTYGLIGGLAGVAIWRQMFRKHPAPPPADTIGFLKQLIPAHMVFCLPLLFDQPKQGRE